MAEEVRARAAVAAVFLNGEYEPEPAFYRQAAEGASMLIGADGGAAWMIKLGLPPSVVVGDFDSLSPLALEELQAKGVRSVRHPVRKDRTDAELAVDEALRMGAGAIDVFGGLGAGFDYAVGHVALLRGLARRRVPARLLEPALTFMVMPARSRLSVSAPPGSRFSLQPLTQRAVVSLRGFDYELRAARLRADACRGLGNMVTRHDAEVLVHAGLAAVHVGAPLQPFWSGMTA